MAGIVYTIISIILSIWIFKSQTSLLYLFFVVLASAPFIYREIANEEKEDINITDEAKRLKSHSRVLGLFLFLFFGITIGTALSYIFLPIVTGNDNIFSLQENVISQVRGPTGNVAHLTVLKIILLNNFKVLLMSLIFSFLYGFGAIFILTWNASIIGVAIGSSILSGLNAMGMSIALSDVANLVSLSLVKYFVHGIFEIAGYFTIGLAGGIISYSIIKDDFNERNIKAIFTDVYELILISIVLIISGSLIEVFIKPVII